MHSESQSGATFEQFEAANLVYIRPIDESELNRILPPNALDELNDTQNLFAVHDSKGQRIAIVEGREAAFEAARANDLKPASLH